MFLVPKSARAASWYNTSWSYRKQITLDNTAQSTTLLNFPVLIPLTSSNFTFSKAQSAGQDIRFTDSDGVTLLSYEIEKWDNTNSMASIWVKIPSLTASTNYNIYMYYGNSSAADAQAATSVWDSNYVGVWHMNDNAASKIVTESTSNANTGTAQQNTSILTTTGRIDGALSFNGTSDRVSVTNSTSLNIANNPISIDAWIKTSVSSGVRIIVRKTSAYEIYINNVSGKLGVLIAWDTVNCFKDGSITVTDGNWHHVAMTYTSGALKTYVDGSLDVNTTSCTSSISGNTLNIGIGAELETPTFFWNGSIDEVRVSNSARSADWILASYKSEAGTMQTFAAEENAPSTAAAEENAPSTATTAPAPAGAPVCGDTAPGGAPTIISIIPGTNSAQINFSQASGPVSYYALEYGTQSGNYIYGAANIGDKNTRSYTVNYLSPGVGYYFRVRAGNGCATGPWSSESSAVTLGVYYPPIIETPVATTAPTPTPFSSPMPITPTETPSPTSFKLPEIELPRLSLPKIAFPTFPRIAINFAPVTKLLASIVEREGEAIAFVGYEIMNTSKTVGKEYANLVSNTQSLREITLLTIGNSLNFLASRIVSTNEKTINSYIAAKTDVSDMAFAIGEKVQDISNTAGYDIIQFGELFVTEPTRIYDVKVAVLSPTSAKISWRTNHPANGKVNYGLDETYPFEIQSDKEYFYHEFTLTNLQPNTLYSFEVMSHNKNYVYDANRKFKTPGQ